MMQSLLLIIKNKKSLVIKKQTVIEVRAYIHLCPSNYSFALAM